MWRWIGVFLIVMQALRVIYRRRYRTILRAQLGLAYADKDGRPVLLPREADDVVLVRKADFERAIYEHEQQLKRATAWQN
jgi:hypothetical protein